MPSGSGHQVDAVRRGDRRWPIDARACASIALIFVACRGEFVDQARSQDFAAAGQSGDDCSKFVGMSSCSLSACHGHADPQPTRVDGPLLNEFQVWFDDPHAGATRTLYTGVSQRMLERLGARPDFKIDSEGGPEFKRHWQNCLGCHSTSGARERNVSDSASYEGVGCEACHGPAERWVHGHYPKPGQDVALIRPKLGGLGFKDTKDLFVRARVCVECHVGREGAHVDHDLIAAGHPMLAFELSTYQRMLPPHWNVEREQKLWGDNDTPEDHQLKSWLGGQLATAQAALELLKWRTSQDTTWPELSEHECFTCHHSLAEDGGWRTDRGFAFAPSDNAPSRRIVAPWRMWNFGLIESILADEAVGHTDSAKAIEELRKTMESSLLPDRNEVAGQLTADNSSVLSWYDKIVKEHPSLRNLDVRQLHHDVLCEAVGTDGTSTVHSWERAAHLYLAVAAEAERDNPSEKLLQLHTLLSEKPESNIDSPASFRGDLGDNLSEHSQREQIRQLLLSIIPPQ